MIRLLGNEGDEIEAVAGWITDHTQAGALPHAFGVFVRSAAQLDRAKAVAEEAELPFAILDQGVEGKAGHISICTMHLANGLEFRAVAVMACDDEIIPLQDRSENANLGPAGRSLSNVADIRL